MTIACSIKRILGFAVIVIVVALPALAGITVISTDSAVTAANSGPGDFTLTNEGSGTRDGIYSYAFNPGAGSDMLVVTVSFEASSEADAVKYNGVNMTLASRSSTGSGAGIWYMPSPAATGTIAIDYTNKGTVNGLGIGIASLSLGEQGSGIVLDTAVSDSGTNRIDITTISNDAFVIFAGDANATLGNPTVNPPLTAIFQGNKDIGSNQAAAGYTNGVPAGTYTYSWSPNSDPRGISVAAFDALPAGTVIIVK